MSGKLSKKLRQLDAFLLSDVVSDNTMLLSELDGILTGLIVCPEMILPSEWMAVVWGGTRRRCSTVSNRRKPSAI